MDSTPLLSVCIPTYNRWRRLNLLVEALSQQIKKDGLQDQVEIVISDNASKDDTRKVGQKWSEKHPFIRYFRNSWNIGGDPNHLRVVSRATGKFAWVLGDDDRVRPGGLVRVLRHLKPDVTQLFLNFRCVDPQGRCLVASRLDPDMPDGLKTTEVIKRVGFMSVFALISTHVFNRELFLAHNAAFVLELSPWYVLNTAILLAFHDREVHLVREPVVDYTVGNERLPPETAIYSRVVKLLRTLQWLERHEIIDPDFLYGCYESGARDTLTTHYFREELYGSLIEISGFWAQPGREDWHLVREFIDRGPGFWGFRHHLKGYFVDSYRAYRQHKKPIIHFWHGKTWVPSFSLLFSSDDQDECRAFDELSGQWPEEFSHESILISRLPEEESFFEHLDVFMAPFRPHRHPSASLNSGFRKVLAPRVFVLDRPDSPAMPAVIKKLFEWETKGHAPVSCLIFESVSEEGPKNLIGLYTQRDELFYRGGFENYFERWLRMRLLADAAFRLRAGAWAAEGGEISRAHLARWMRDQLPLWQRVVRSVRRGPFSEHGLNINFRHHLLRLNSEADA